MWEVWEEEEGEAIEVVVVVAIGPKEQQNSEERAKAPEGVEVWGDSV